MNKLKNSSKKHRSHLTADNLEMCAAEGSAAAIAAAMAAGRTSWLRPCLFGPQLLTCMQNPVGATHDYYDIIQTTPRGLYAAGGKGVLTSPTLV